MQDGVLKLIKKLKTPFYLTGGTAISRIYFNHRYSDDLDFFVNSDSRFDEYCLDIYNVLKGAGFYWDEKDAFVGVNYKRLVVQSKEYPYTELKLDFVNDIEVHYGDLVSDNLFDKIDSIQNILSNKISALFRYAEKDIVDLLFIAKSFKFHWDEVVSEARNKDLGIENYLVSDILRTFPKPKLENIKWVGPQNLDNMMSDIQTMARDCIEVKPNSLCIA
ncbi:MAG: nucleotidyl transferase AbiEii/AbiGii toxin family protein [Leptospira sp.]|nr:nucleotidyl transferase AbiEii/AbiGii toxin family protein [Leptospira sp.]